MQYVTRPNKFRTMSERYAQTARIDTLCDAYVQRRIVTGLHEWLVHNRAITDHRGPVRYRLTHT